MEATGDSACPISVQKEENVSAVRPPGLLRIGRTLDLPGVQILLQDPGQFAVKLCIEYDVHSSQMLEMSSNSCVYIPYWKHVVVAKQ